MKAFCKASEALFQCWVLKIEKKKKNGGKPLMNTGRTDWRRSPPWPLNHLISCFPSAMSWRPKQWAEANHSILMYYKPSWWILLCFFFLSESSQERHCQIHSLFWHLLKKKKESPHTWAAYKIISSTCDRCLQAVRRHWAHAKGRVDATSNHGTALKRNLRCDRGKELEGARSSTTAARMPSLSNVVALSAVCLL